MTTTLKSPKRSIVIRNQFEGFHCWPDAPEPVAFLRNLHRHVFKVECTFDVSHPDRQLEFFMTQREVSAAVEEVRLRLVNNRSMSCEMMAEQIFQHLFPTLNIVRVVVSEDGENDGVYEEAWSA